MPQKGIVMPLSSTTLHVEEAVEILTQYGQPEFHCKEVAELTRSSPRLIGSVLAHKTKQGCFERVSPGCYRKVPGTKISLRLPSAFIAEKAWPIVANSPNFISTEVAAMEVERLAGRKELMLKKRVDKDYYRWYKLGYLERRGKRGCHEYKIFPKFFGIERPPLE